MGKGFLLVFFPEEHPQTITTTTKNFNSSSSSSSPLSSLIFKRANSSHLLLHKAQSTISICLLLLFTTLLLFTLSTLPSSTTTAAAARRLYAAPRRHLIQLPNPPPNNLPHALQGMGTLYRRGTRAMNDVVVAHAVENLTLHELKLFVRLLYRSSLTARSDLLFVFPSKTTAFDNAILQETESFSKLVTQYGEKLSGNESALSQSGFDPTHFMKAGKESREPIWGKKSRGNFSEEGETELTRPSYGSVVGFDVEELDPENSLSGFLDHVSMSLRRWACYPMLLGRVRRNFKHVMLVDIKEMLLLGDPLGRVRGHSPESVLVKVVTQLGKHGRKNPDKNRQKLAHPGIVMGGSRGVRRVSNAMLTDIVRASMQHKKKNPVTESGLFNQLIGNDFVLKNVNLIVSTESMPEVSSLVAGLNRQTGSHLFTTNYTMIRRGNSNLNVSSIVMKHICSFPIDSMVYSDC